jgi:hypothetical protein
MRRPLEAQIDNGAKPPNPKGTLNPAAIRNPLAASVSG